jgi:hypothetical protein
MYVFMCIALLLNVGFQFRVNNTSKEVVCASYVVINCVGLLLGSDLCVSITLCVFCVYSRLVCASYVVINCVALLLGSDLCMCISLRVCFVCVFYVLGLFVPHILLSTV